MTRYISITLPITLITLLGFAALAQVPRFEQSPASALAGLQSLDETTRRTSVISLGGFRKNPQAKAALASVLLEDPDVAVRQSAAIALKKMPKTREILIRAAICDPDSSIREDLASLARRHKIQCHTFKVPRKMAKELPKTKRGLLRFLAHPSPATRLAAARRLAKYRSAQGYRKIWIMTTRDPVWSIRKSAIRILARAYGKKLLPNLRHTLTKDPDVRVRIVAMKALGFLKSPKTITWILTSAKAEQVPSIQLSAVEALIAIKGRNAAIALAELAQAHPNEDVRVAAVKGIIGLKSRKKQNQMILAKVVRTDQSGKVRAVALAALANTKSTSSCAARAELLNEPQVEVRRTVIAQMIKCPAKVARPALAKAALADNDPGNRRDAIKLLIKAGPAKAKVTLLTALAKDRDPLVRKWALSGVLKLKMRDRHAALAQVIQSDSEPKLRLAAIRGLAKGPALTVVPAMIQVLAHDRETKVRIAAATALTRFSEAAAYQALKRAAVKDSAEEVRQIAIAGAAKSPAQRAWINSLLPQIIDSSVKIRLNAVMRLCPLQVPRTYRALMLALWNDRDLQIRKAVAGCFADINHPLADIGLSVAHDTDTDANLIHVVEQTQRKRVDKLQTLLQLSKSGDPLERVDVAKKLPPSPNKKVRALLERLLSKDPDPRVRMMAALSVTRYKDRRALQRLMRAGQLEKNPAARRKIVKLYNWLRARWSRARGQLNINTLILALRSDRLKTQLRAAQALGVMQDRRAFNALHEATKSQAPRLRYEAVLALAMFGDLAVIEKAARTEADPKIKAQLIQLNYLSSAPEEKIIAALTSEEFGEVQKGVEAMAIKHTPKAMPWLVKAALSHVDKKIRGAAVRTLVLYDLPLARWALLVSAGHDASKKLRKEHWKWAVHADAKGH